MVTSRAAYKTPTRVAAPLLAYVLHRYDWSETSLIVELFTRSAGRVVVVAKGAKRPTSQLRPVLLPFQPLLALLGKAPADEASEVRTLRSAEWVGGVPLLDAASMLCAYYLNELLLKLLARQDPHPQLFDAYADTLAALAQHEDEASTLRAFELALLRELGVLPDLSVATLTTQALHAQQTYRLHADAGLVAHAQGLPGSTWVALEAALQHAAQSADWAALRLFCAQASTPGRALLQEGLRGLLHYHLGHDRLRTRQVWRGVQKLGHVPAA
jgi:DNA repair protein RecO (recombination protein O)